MSDMHPSVDCRSAGFTLVETLVAFAIAAVLLGGIYDLYSGGIRAAIGGTRSGEAVLVAQSALESLTNVKLSPGTTADRAGVFDRETTVRARPDLVAEGGQVSLMAYEVMVRVVWREGIRERSVSLTTLRLSPP